MGDDRQQIIKRISQSIASVPDFPELGVIYRDITPLLAQPSLFESSIKLMLEPFVDKEINKIISIESRGFIFAAPMSYRLNAGLILARKENKLPRQCISINYELEYGQNTLQVHKDAITAGDKVLVVDDVLATGGTANATRQLIEKAGGQVVGYSFLIELTTLAGRQSLRDAPVHRVLQYD